MLVYTLPACHMTEARIQEMCLLIDNIPDKELQDTTLWDDAEENETKAQADLKSWFIDFTERLASQELACIDDSSWLYPLYITGGMSHGDHPTEIAEPMFYLECVEPLWNRLAMWAREDKWHKVGLYGIGHRLHHRQETTTNG